MLGNGIIETTTTTGTGDLTTSAVTGRPRFTDKFTANATEASAGHFYYAILTQDNPPQFIESGIGYMSATGTLKRAVVLSTYASSTYTDVSASAVSLAAGTKNVICTGEAGAAGGLALPAMDNSVSALRYITSAHIPVTAWSSTLAMTANRLYMQPFLFNAARAVDGLYFRQSSAGAANYRLGLWECNRDGTPGRKIMGSTADLATTTSGVNVVTTGGPVRLAPGWYYMGIVSDGTPTINTGSVANLLPNPLGHDGVQYAYSYGYLANGSTTLPDPASAVTSKVTQNTIAIHLGMRLVA